jgi:hypothetical protein
MKIPATRFAMPGELSGGRAEVFFASQIEGGTLGSTVVDDAGFLAVVISHANEMIAGRYAWERSPLPTWRCLAGCRTGLRGRRVLS